MFVTSKEILKNFKQIYQTKIGPNEVLNASKNILIYRRVT